jgi:superfamily II DNA/RNA helicase
MLFSATMPGAVIGLARRYMSQPTHIRATAPDDQGATVANITQRVYRAHSMDKPEMVSRILQADGRGLVMIFCRTKRTAADIAEQLARRGFASGAVHGDLGQGAREQALRAFRNGKVDVLVCTDVAARGIDVEGVTHVINYQSPEDEKTYLHRVGRTARAGASGTAVTLVDWDDIPRWQLINKALDLGFSDPVETYSTSPHLFEELGIPAGTKGVLPRAERTRAGLGAEEVEDLGETGGRGRKSSPSAAPTREERAPRTPRQRRRTRSGSTPLDAPEPTLTPDATDAPDASDAPAEPRPPRRRRRTRVAAPAAVGTVELVEAEVAVETVEAEVATKPRRRTRTVKVADPVEAVATVEAEPETKPRRRTRAAKPVVEAVVDATTEPETKPRRRTRAAKPVVEAVVDTPEPETKPRRRTRTVKAAQPES